MSESDYSDYSDSPVTSISSDEEEQDLGIVDGEFLPYQDEPLQDPEEADNNSDFDDDEETDADGLTPAMLESRFEREVDISTW